MPSPKATQASDSKVPLKCHQWMKHLWDDLRAQSAACDARINSTNAKILLKDSAPIRPTLQEKLSKTKRTLLRLVKNRPRLRRHSREYQTKAANLRTNALLTIFEGNAGDATVPKIPQLSDKKKLATWVDESVQVYGKLISSDRVDASIKPRIKKIRQSLWTYRGTRKELRMDNPGGRKVLSRSDFQCLGTEVSVMLAVTTKITKYMRLLDGNLVDAYFRPRLLVIVEDLKSFQEKQFRIGADSITTVGEYEEEVDDHLAIRAQADWLLEMAEAGIGGDVDEIITEKEGENGMKPESGYALSF